MKRWSMVFGGVGNGGWWRVIDEWFATEGRATAGEAMGVVGGGVWQRADGQQSSWQRTAEEGGHLRYFAFGSAYGFLGFFAGDTNFKIIFCHFNYH